MPQLSPNYLKMVLLSKVNVSVKTFVILPLHIPQVQAMSINQELLDGLRVDPPLELVASLPILTKTLVLKLVQTKVRVFAQQQFL
jgi:hypothetical protein